MSSKTSTTIMVLVSLNVGGDTLVGMACENQASCYHRATQHGQRAITTSVGDESDLLNKNICLDKG